jgi:hypothetical protein
MACRFHGIAEPSGRFPAEGSGAFARNPLAFMRCGRIPGSLPAAAMPVHSRRACAGSWLGDCTRPLSCVPVPAASAVRKPPRAPRHDCRFAYETIIFMTPLLLNLAACGAHDSELRG